MEGKTDGSITISLRNFVGEGLKKRLTCYSALRKLNTELSIGASHQVSVHLAK